MNSSQPYTQPSTAVDDTGSGLTMFLIFTAAVLIVTGAVALLALVGTWWMLGVTFAIDLSMTTIVVLTIVFVMDGRAQKIATRGRALAAPGRPGDANPHPAGDCAVSPARPATGRPCSDRIALLGQVLTCPNPVLPLHPARELGAGQRRQLRGLGDPA